MKKMAVALLMLFTLAFIPPVQAHDIVGLTTTVTDTNYTVNVIELRNGTLRVEVRGINTYGTYLQNFTSKDITKDGKITKYLEVAFDLSNGAEPSTAYVTTFPKSKFAQVILSVQSGNIQEIKDKVIWTSDIRLSPKNIIQQ